MCLVLCYVLCDGIELWVLQVHTARMVVVRCDVFEFMDV